MSSPTYVVQPVESRKDKKEFLHLPWVLYKNDPNWIPPLRMGQAELTGIKKHPFYNENTVRNFMVRRDGKICGRVSAIVNNGHIKRYEEQRGFLGFFECENDPAAAAALLTAACKYLKSQGMTDVRGPANPSLNYECGTLVDGFDSPPTFMMTYNSDYYNELWTGFGFEKTQDLYAFDADVSMISSLDPKLQFIIDEVKKRFNVNVRRMNRSKFAEEVNMFLNIYNRSLEATWGFVPLSPEEVKELGRGLKYLLVPEMTTIVEVDGKPIGSGLGLLDYNPIIKKIDGRLFPFGFLRLLFDRKGIKRVRLMSTNILPEYQRWGFGLVALERMLPDALNYGITHGEFSWVLESNHLSRASLERGGAHRAKTFRIYDRSLSDM